MTSLPPEKESFGIRRDDSSGIKLTDIGMAVILIILVGVGVFSNKTKFNLVERSHRIAQTNAILLELKDTLDSIQNADRGTSNYLLSGDPAFLDLYTQTNSSLGPHMANLYKLVESDVDQREEINRLNSLLQEKLRQLYSSIILRQSKDYTPERLELSVTQGGLIMDDIHKVGTKIEASERLLLEEHVQDSNDVASGFLIRIIAIITMLCLLLIGTRVVILRHERGRRKAEDDLKETSLALEHAVEGISRVDDAGMYVAVNTPFATMLQTEPSRLVGKPWMSVVNADDHVKVQAAFDLMQLKGKAETEVKALRKDGSDFYLKMTMVSALDDSDKRLSGHYCFIKDSTQERREQQELINARKAALEASLAKTEFLANMSHEIRTPMNGVIGMSGLLSQTVLNDHQRQYVDTIKVSAEALLALINDILDLSKIESRKMVLETIDFNFTELVQDSFKILSHSARTKGIGLNFDISEKLPKSFRGDPSKLRQILINLLGNAVKFTAKGEVSLFASVVQEAADFVELRVEITDTGIGMKPETLEKLFQPFSQADGSTTRVFGGTGLGLAICKRLIEMMGGEIGLKSEENVGSTFWFTVKLQEGNEIRPVQELISEVQALTQHANTLGARILIVEDNPVNQRVAFEMLSKMGFKGDIAENGKVALSILAQNHYDLIIMDCQMPVMDGYETAREIRKIEKITGAHVPIIAATADATSGDRQKSFEAGMDDYITKPIEFEKFSNMIHQWLAQRTPKAFEEKVEAHALTPPISVPMAPEPSIDWATLNRMKEFQKADGPDLIKELVELFLESAPPLIKSIKDAVAEKNREKIKSQAHALKSSSGNLGIQKIYKTCQRLEVMAKDSKDITDLSPVVEGLAREFEKASSELIHGLAYPASKAS